MDVKHLLIWFLLAVVATANGIIRQSTYGKQLSELAAHQVSTLTAVVATGLLVWVANHFWPIGSARQAWIVGVSWLAMTMAFEFGFGHYVAGHSWDRLLADYNLKAGRVWSLFLLWILIMPFVVYQFSR